MSGPWNKPLHLALCGSTCPTLGISAFAARVYPIFAVRDADPEARIYTFPGGTLGVTADRGFLCGNLDSSELREAMHWLGLRWVLRENPLGEYCVLCRPAGFSVSPEAPVLSHDLEESFRILRQDPRFRVDLERYYWLRSLLRRREAGEVFTENGSTAELFYSGSRSDASCALLCNVMTDPALRRRGNAGTLIQKVLAGLTIPVFLFCLPELQPFYLRLGFSVCGRAELFSLPSEE